MPENRLAKARQSLPEGYVYQPPRACIHDYRVEPVGAAVRLICRLCYHDRGVTDGVRRPVMQSFDTNCDPGDEVDLQSTDQVPDTGDLHEQKEIGR